MTSLPGPPSGAIFSATPGCNGSLTHISGIVELPPHLPASELSGIWACKLLMVPPLWLTTIQIVHFFQVNDSQQASKGWWFHRWLHEMALHDNTHLGRESPRHMATICHIRLKWTPRRPLDWMDLDAAWNPGLTLRRTEDRQQTF